MIITSNRNVTYIQVDSISELFSQLNEFAYFPSYVYRGHGDSTWLLESTLSRALKKIESSDKSSLINKHLEEFKFAIRGRRGQNPRNLDENELWALGQHFGLHTPLLDWSYSPYVALFFALERVESPASGIRAVWALNSTDIVDINDSHNTKPEFRYRWEISEVKPVIDENNRLLSQRGLFTKLPLGGDIESWVLAGPNLEWVSLYKLEFSESIRDHCLAILNLMNINHASLYPDLVGSARYTNLLLEQTDYLTTKQKEYWKNESGGRLR